MGTKKTSKKPKRSKAKTGPKLANASPIMATRNLINMVAMGVTSGAVLITLLAARHL